MLNFEYLNLVFCCLQVNLISEGFQDAKTLGRKLVALFSLGRQLLSRQQHYDWGLRALKTVLGTAGQLLHQAKGKGEEVRVYLLFLCFIL